MISLLDPIQIGENPPCRTGYYVPAYSLAWHHQATFRRNLWSNIYAQRAGAGLIDLRRHPVCTAGRLATRMCRGDLVDRPKSKPGN